MKVAPLVIGVGNEHRGDDAAGIEVARRLASSRVREVTDCATLLDVWEGEENVIVVDAMRSGRPTGFITRFDGLAESFPTSAFPSTHSFGIADAIQLGRVLARLPDQLTVYGIEASNIKPGDEMSAEVSVAIDEVVDLIEAA